MPSLKGISTTSDCTAKAPQLARTGFSFVARYYCGIGTQAKTLLSFPEAQALSRAGVRMVAVYEEVANKAEYFNFSAGHTQGIAAYTYAKNTIHQAGGSAIYFAVDFDASNTDVSGPINDYFAGVEQAFQDAALGDPPVYAPGVYGSGLCCQWLRTHRPAVKYAWLAESSGWQGFSSYNKWDIKQSFMKQSVCGFKIDPKDPGNNEAELNTAVNDFGGFVVPV